MARAQESRVKESVFTWEGRDKTGKILRGEARAGGQAVIKATLRRQGITVTKIRKHSFGQGGRISDRDITLFTRQLSTMMKAGVPLLQAFDIVGKGATKPAVGKLLLDVRLEVETGASLTQAFRKYPRYFDPLFCNLVQAGEQGGILDTLLDRLATYKEKTEAIKGKIKSALFYPIFVVVASFLVMAVMMIFVIPQFKAVFKSFGAELPAPTLFVVAISDAFVAYWYLIFGFVGAGVYTLIRLYKTSQSMQALADRLILQAPVFGALIRKATVARWTRTLSTMFAAGVPLVEGLDSVGGAAGNVVYKNATRQIQGDISTGTSLTVAMQNSGVFPTMVVQMVSIGEESGQLDGMLSKVADFYEQEVDDAVKALSSLVEPFIIVLLGGIIGGLVVAMYLPIFKVAQSV